MKLKLQILPRYCFCSYSHYYFLWIFSFVISADKLSVFVSNLCDWISKSLWALRSAWTSSNLLDLKGCSFPKLEDKQLFSSLHRLPHSSFAWVFNQYLAIGPIFVNQSEGSTLGASSINAIYRAKVNLKTSVIQLLPRISLLSMQFYVSS